MKEIVFIYGTNISNFLIIPTIRYDRDWIDCKYLTVEWLKWYIGIKWWKE